MSTLRLTMAVPWAGSHYIPLNGFHPLYRALFDHSPSEVFLNSWNNVSLYNKLVTEKPTLELIVKKVSEKRKNLGGLGANTIESKYYRHIAPENQVLTDLLPGEIEFLHTALYPSMQRPFIFYCESFAPIFMPFCQQGGDVFNDIEELRNFYQRILESDLCLGIFSHVSTTLESFKLFFKSEPINKKLKYSRIGLSEVATNSAEHSLALSKRQNIFLFVNPENENPQNFFHSGGHLVLRFWELYCQSGCQGTLILRCQRPTNEDLKTHGVDVNFLNKSEGLKIIWSTDYLTSREVNKLYSISKFLLLPSLSLHSTSILMALTFGAIPVVTDTIGTEVYIQDGANGIVLKGVKDFIWSVDRESGILISSFKFDRKLDDFLVHQMYERVIKLLDNHTILDEITAKMKVDALDKFSGKFFAYQFFSDVQYLYGDFLKNRSTSGSEIELDVTFNSCLLKKSEWGKNFDSVSQPVKKLFTGQSSVWVLGGSIIYGVGNPSMRLHDWSVISQFCSERSPKISFENSFEELVSKHLYLKGTQVSQSRHIKAIAAASKILRGYPHFHKLARDIYRKSILFSRRIKTLIINITLRTKVEVIQEEYQGYLLVRHFDKFYAIFQLKDNFDISKFKDGGYRIAFCCETITQLKIKIESSLKSHPSIGGV